MNFKRIIIGFLALLCLTTSVVSQIQAGRAIQITVSGVPPEEKGRFDPCVIEHFENIRRIE